MGKITLNYKSNVENNVTVHPLSRINDALTLAIYV